MFANTVAAIFHDGKWITENQIKIMNNGWMGKGDGVGGGSRGRGRGRGDLTKVKPLKPAKEVSDEKRSRGEVALFRVIKSKVEEEMEKEDKVEEEPVVKNPLPSPNLLISARQCARRRREKTLKVLQTPLTYIITASR